MIHNVVARRWDLLALASLLGAAVFGALMFDRLPEPVPTHFDLSGNPNGWMPRAIVWWAIPAGGLLLWAVVRFLSRVIPQSDRKRISETSVALVAMLVSVFIASVQVVILYASATPGMKIIPATFLIVSAFLVALGLVMPRIRRNPIIGIRTPWTLTSDENWARTHRVAGYAMVLGGVFGALFSAADGLVGGALAIACWVVAGIVPAVYSLVIARRVE